LILEAAVEGRQVRVEVQARGDAYDVLLDGRPWRVDWHEGAGRFVSMLVDGRSYDVGLEVRPEGVRVTVDETSLEIALQEATSREGPVAPAHKAGGPARVSAPMPGKVVRVLVAPGDDVVAAQGLLVMEAMKMENEMRAPRTGRVREVYVREGQAVETGAALVLLE
jgi:biotin carboxyl carrier protein